MKKQTKPPAINFKHIIISFVLIAFCVYTGYITTTPHRAEITTGIINTQIAAANTFIPDKNEQMQTVTVDEINQVYTSQTNVMSAMDYAPIIFKILVIASMAAIIFAASQTTGLIPRFAGES